MTIISITRGYIDDIHIMLPVFAGQTQYIRQQESTRHIDSCYMYYNVHQFTNCNTQDIK